LVFSDLKTILAFPTIRNLKITRSVLWILGEYCDTKENILEFMTELRKSIGEVPIVASEMKKAAGEEDSENAENTDTAEKPKKSAQRVTADGTYITQSALVTSSKKEDTSQPPLRGFLLDGEFFIGSVLATTLTKLGLKFAKLCDEPRKQNAFLAECMLIMTSVLHLGRSGYAKKQIPEDDSTRISACIKVKMIV